MFSFVVLSAFVASALAHGNVQSPPARPTGSNMKAVCGGVVEGLLASDIFTNQQQLEQVGLKSDDSLHYVVLILDSSNRTLANQVVDTL